MLSKVDHEPVAQFLRVVFFVDENSDAFAIADFQVEDQLHLQVIGVALRNVSVVQTEVLDVLPHAVVAVVVVVTVCVVPIPVVIVISVVKGPAAPLVGAVVVMHSLLVRVVFTLAVLAALEEIITLVLTLLEVEISAEVHVAGCQVRTSHLLTLLPWVALSVATSLVPAVVVLTLPVGLCVLVTVHVSVHVPSSAHVLVEVIVVAAISTAVEALATLHVVIVEALTLDLLAVVQRVRIYRVYLELHIRGTRASDSWAVAPTRAVCCSLVALALRLLGLIVVLLPATRVLAESLMLLVRL